MNENITLGNISKLTEKLTGKKFIIYFQKVNLIQCLRYGGMMVIRTFSFLIISSWFFFWGVDNNEPRSSGGGGERNYAKAELCADSCQISTIFWIDTENFNFFFLIPSKKSSRENIVSPISEMWEIAGFKSFRIIEIGDFLRWRKSEDMDC